MRRGLRWLLARDDALLALVLALALLCAVPLLWARAVEEQANRTLDLTMDLDELEEVARSWGQPLDAVLVDLRARGLTSLAVEEVTLSRLAYEGAAAVLSGADLSALARAGVPLAPLAQELLDGGQIRPGCTYAFTEDWDVYNRILTGARRHLPGDSCWSRSSGGLYAVGLAGERDELQKMGLGLWERDLQVARRTGLSVVARPLNWPGATDRDIEDLFRLLDGYNVSAVSFAGYEALGYPDRLAVTAREMGRRGLPLGMVEAPVQRGFILQRGTDELAALLDHRVVRVYALARKELDKLHPADAVDRWLRGAKERNIRVLYMRPLLEGEARGQELAATADYVSLVAAELHRAGFVFGPARPFAPLGVRLRYAWVLACGVVAAGLLLLRRLAALPRVLTWSLFAAGCVGWLALRLLGPDVLLRQAAALGAALVFPGLALAWAVERARRLAGGGPAGGTVAAGDDPAGAASGAAAPPRRRISAWRLLAEGALLVAGATAITLAGAALVGAILGDIRFLLEMEYFRGVKLSYVVPPLVALLAYAAAFDITTDGREGRGLRRYVRQARAVLVQPLSVLHLVLLLALAGMAVLYLGRAGNTAGLPVSNLEIEVRSWLEHTLWARPRLKEFLLGQPVLMLVPLCAAWGPRPLLPLLFLLAGIGQVSVINSFEHLRTQFLVSLLRTGHGVWLGLLVGAAALAVGLLLWHWWLRRGRAAGSGATPQGGGGPGVVTRG